jgi:hypothetical protein
MRRLLVVMVGLSCSALLAGSAASAGAGGPQCSSAASHTVVQTARVRVLNLNRTFYACWLRSGRTVKIGRSSARTSVQFAQVAGRYVVFARNVNALAPGSGGGDSRVGRVDVQRGRLRWEPGCAGVVTGAVLNQRGSVAWTCESDPHTAYTALLRHDSRGRTILDQSGTDSAGLIASLAMSGDGRRLFWTRGGTAQTADFR